MLDNNFSRLYSAVCLQQHKTRPLSIHGAVLVAPHMLGFGWGFWDDGSSSVSWFLRSFSWVLLAGIPSEMITNLKPINVCGMSSWCRKLKGCRHYYICYRVNRFRKGSKCAHTCFRKSDEMLIISLNLSLIICLSRPYLLKCYDVQNHVGNISTLQTLVQP